MPKIPLPNLTRLGLIQDIEPQALAMGAWSGMRNARINNGRVEKFKGHSQVYGELLHSPYGLLYTTNQLKQAWLYMGLTHVAAYIDGNHFDVTPEGFTFGTSISDLWTADLFFNLPLLNNGVDVPHIWADIDEGEKLIPLPNWPATWRAKVLRPFKNYIMGLDLTEDGTRYPHLQFWSNPAAPGEVPSSWDHTDPTNDAGRVDLGDGQGGILIDALPLRNSMIIYKERSVWETVITGNPVFPLANEQLFIGEAGMGILSRHCVSPIREGTSHFVVGSEFIYIHDGRQHERISANRVEEALYRDINPEAINRCFTALNVEYSEVWFCYPEVDAIWPSKALVWNWREGQFYPRDLLPAATIRSGVILVDGSEQALYWDAEDMEGDWDDWTGSWYPIRHHPGERKLLQADPINSKLYYLDDGDDFGGQPIVSWVERLSLPLTEEATGGKLRAEKGDRLQVTETWPQATGGGITVQLGAGQVIDGPITWTSVKPFNPKTQQNIPFYVTGVEIALRVALESPEAQFWGMSLVVDVTGISR